jgi:hypothetical protein
MSSLSKGDVARRARERLTDWPEAKTGFTIPRLQTLVDGALTKLARIIAADSKRSDLLVPAAGFPETVTAGEIDLQAVIAANNILLDYLDGAEIQMADLTVNAFPFQWVASQGELALQRITDSIFIHCCLTGTLLQTKNTDGSLTSLDGNIVIFSNYIPTMAQLPVSLDDSVIDLVADMAKQEFMNRSQRSAA